MAKNPSIISEAPSSYSKPEASKKPPHQDESETDSREQLIAIVEGPPGVGKTILGNQICFNRALAGRKVLYVTLISETVARMLLNIKSLTFFNEDQVGSGIVYISGFSALKDKGLTGLLHLLRKEVSTRKATILVVDGFASASDHARSHEELKLFVQQLQTQADAADCTVFLLTNPTEHTPSSEETMVDGIISLKTTLHEWRSARELCVRKFRGSSFLQGVHSYDINEDGVSVYPRLETLISPSADINGDCAEYRQRSRLDECWARFPCALRYDAHWAFREPARPL